MTQSFSLKLSLALLCLTTSLMAQTPAVLPQAPATPVTPATAPAAAAIVPDEPQVTTAAYGEWSLRCVSNPPTAPYKGKVCEITQSLTLQGQTAPFAQFAFTKAETGDNWRFLAVFPPNVSFPSTVQMKITEKSNVLEMNWMRCLPQACVAEGLLTPAMVNDMKATAEPSKIMIKDGTGRQVVSPINFRGLTQALAAY